MLLDSWNNGPAFVKQFRFGGGAGELDFALESKDTDTRDPNALDVIVGPASRNLACSIGRRPRRSNCLCSNSLREVRCAGGS
jgi:hypothetical protein